MVKTRCCETVKSVANRRKGEKSRGERERDKEGKDDGQEERSHEADKE